MSSVYVENVNSRSHRLPRKKIIILINVLEITYICLLIISFVRTMSILTKIRHKNRKIQNNIHDVAGKILKEFVAFYA